jgi:nitrite reductase (NO-forming)
MAERPGPRTRRFSPIRDLPAAVWLLAVVVVALVHRDVPAPRWLLFHLLLLGAATHSILVWSQHFADALLHAAPSDSDRRVRTVRLAVLNLGVVAVVAGVLTDQWHLTATGASGVALAVGWHGVDLVRQLRRALGSRFATTVRYYVAAASLLPVGALLGVLMARGVGETAHARLMAAHVELNVLGWVGLSVLGTLVTLWPTMLRTRLDEAAERAARRALPLLYAGLLVTVTSTLLAPPPVAVAGLVAYAAAVVVLGLPFARTLRRKPATQFATWSVLAGVAWWAATLVWLAGILATSTSWMGVHERLSTLTPALAVGFVAQVLLGALSYLLPVNVGRGPASTRAATAVLDRAAGWRIATTNGGLLITLLPVPSAVRVAVSVVVLAALATFVPLMLLALPAARKPKDGGPAAGTSRSGQLVTGLATVVLALALGVAVDPQAIGRSGSASAAAGVTATGRTTTIDVDAADMRFSPALLRVPVGNRLVIRLHNTDDQDVHDLVLDSGADSGRLSPGDSTTLDVGVVGRDLDGWCSIVGHRQMGMVLSVQVVGAPAASASGHSHGPGDSGGMPAMAGESGSTGAPASPGSAGSGAASTPFTPYDARLGAPAPGRVHRVTLRVTEADHQVAPGVTQHLWTYNGTAPGPVLHGRVGDVFVVRLVNDGTIGHSVDFHAGQRAPDRVMRTIPPGGTLVYRFRAEHAGIWMYHCSSMPMSAHIANGLFGAVVIEPRGVPHADRSFVLLQSELYLGADGGTVDYDKLLAEQPDLVVFNGYANQYDEHPLRVRTGERVRVWVLDAGPNRPSSFHVVGEQFDDVWSEGAWRLPPAPGGGAQVLPLLPAQGGFVDLTFDEPGHYPFVSHLMVDAERGAHGLFAVR